MAQIEQVGQQGAGRVDMLAAGDGQLLQAQVAYPGCALAAEPDQPVAERHACLQGGVGRLAVEVGPGQGEVELLHERLASVLHRPLGATQHVGRGVVGGGKHAPILSNI